MLSSVGAPPPITPPTELLVVSIIVRVFLLLEVGRHANTDAQRHQRHVVRPIVPHPPTRGVREIQSLTVLPGKHEHVHAIVVRREHAGHIADEHRARREQAKRLGGLDRVSRLARDPPQPPRDDERILQVMLGVGAAHAV